MSLKCSAIRLCLSIELFSCKFDCKMQSTCTAGKCNCIFAANFFSNKNFCFIDIFASCGDPVFLKRIIYPLLLVTMHCWR